MNDVENAMVIPLLTDYFYRAEPEDDGDRDDRIYDTRKEEEHDRKAMQELPIDRPLAE